MTPWTRDLDAKLDDWLCTRLVQCHLSTETFLFTSLHYEMTWFLESNPLRFIYVLSLWWPANIACCDAVQSVTGFTFHCSFWYLRRLSYKPISLVLYHLFVFLCARIMSWFGSLATLPQWPPIKRCQEFYTTSLKVVLLSKQVQWVGTETEYCVKHWAGC